ncbi:MAG: inositol monophosphatase [Pelagimonas sp.]|jgi:fructose-1,6-bisphosphatase/inositol monophosphatase family enzyme|nr:inositol monophosphatase [Pelagimonas sp.]
MTDSLPIAVTAPLTKAQRTQLLNLVRRVAKSEIMPHFKQLDLGQIDTKSSAQDLVTTVDRTAEAMLTRGILTMFPNALIIGEEMTSDNPVLIEKIADAELCFTIDPVDGTWNYAKGLPLFGVMISVLRFGIPVFGLLFDPVSNDVVIADTDNQAELIRPRRGVRKLKTSRGGDLGDLTGYVPLALLPGDKRAEMAETYPQFGRVHSLRCACHEARMVAQGHADFVLFAKLTPWDQPAGVVAVQKAGGHVAMLDGTDYRGDIQDGYLLMAANKETWDKLRDLFDFLVDQPDRAERSEPAEETA